MSIKVKINTTEAHYQNALRGQQHAIARPNGVIWVVYFDFDGVDGDILVAYSSDGGATWTEEIAVPNARCYGWDGLSIMVSTDSVPHIIYFYVPAAGNAEIRYVNRAGGSWGTPETVYDIGPIAICSYLKAVIDGSNTIHIIWERTVINYLSGVAGSWGARETADVDGTRPDITINNSNQPVIVFVTATGIHIRYRDGTWQPLDTVDPDDGTFPIPMIRVDTVGDYHVAWQNEENVAPWNYEVYYRKKESGAWLARQELQSSASQWYIGLGLDASGNAYVIYQSRGTNEAVYYKKVTAGTTVGAETTIDLDILRPNNNPSIYTYLWHKYPGKGVLGASFQPIVVLLDEVPVGFPYADLYFYAEKYVLKVLKGNPNIDQLIYQHVERMGR